MMLNGTMVHEEQPVPMALLEVDNLTKDYGFGRGVFDVSFHVEEGEVFGFLGPNGAGKTTTIRHIMGFSKPEKGSTTVDSMDGWAQAERTQRELGYLPGEIALPSGLTGTQFIRYMAELRGVTDLSKTEYLLRKFDLDPSGRLKRMSLGMKRKLAIVTAFMHDPRILALDEPTSGLDVQSARLMRDIVREMNAEGLTVFLTTHNMAEAQEMCDRVAIISGGSVVAIDTPDTLRSAMQSSQFVEVRFAGGAAPEDELRALPGVEQIEGGPDGYRLFAEEPGRAATEAVRLADRSGLRIAEIATRKPTLEDVFVHLTGRSDGEDRE